MNPTSLSRSDSPLAVQISEDPDVPAQVHTVTTVRLGETDDRNASIRGVVRRVWKRLFGGCGKVACWVGATAGALPHVLHLLGPLAGTAFVSGADGTLLSAGMGLAVVMPLLLYEYRHTGGWRAPFLFLVASAAMFMVSTLFLGDLLGSNAAEQPPIDVDQHPQH